MKKSDFFQQSLITTLGRRAGYFAFKCRRQKERLQHYTAQIQLWRNIFPLGEVISLGVAALGLVALDFFFMWPNYRLASQILCNDANLLVIPLGLGINILAVITSEKLSKCSASGPFYKWEVLKQGESNSDTAKLLLSFNRKNHMMHFILHLALFLAVLLILIWIRSVMIAGSQSMVETVELQLSILGLLFAFFAVAVGMYLIPLAQYVIWSSKILFLEMQINMHIRKVSNLDDNIHSLWRQIGMPENNCQDIKESLVRSWFRTNSLEYCDPVTEQELTAYISNLGNLNNNRTA